MAYTEDGIRSKLSTLNETQESIVTVAQFLMFPRRQQWVEKTAILWLEKVKESNANKRLNLLYLANEVVQQSKGRKRTDFLDAFSPLIPEATSVSFRGAHAEVRHKIKRVVEVWRQRNIFDEATQRAVEARITDLEKNPSSGTKRLLGGSLFAGGSTSGASAPEELKSLVTLQESANKATTAAGSSGGGADGLAEKAQAEYSKTMESITSLSPPVQVARYSQLFKTLANAESAVAESVKATRDLLTELEILVRTNQEKLTTEEAQQTELSTRKTEIGQAKRDAEDSIMRGLASVPLDENDEKKTPTESTTNGGGGNNNNSQPHETSYQDDEPARPQTEELTPPPVENLTPVDSPEFQPADIVGDSVLPLDEPDAVMDDKWNVPEAGADLLASLSRNFSSTDMADEEPVAKRQRMQDDEGDMHANADEGGTPGFTGDVDELIRSQGQA